MTKVKNEDFKQANAPEPIRRKMEKIGEDAGVFIKFEVVSPLNAPRGIVHIKGNVVGVLQPYYGNWIFLPSPEVKVKLAITAVTCSQLSMVDFLKELHVLFPGPVSLSVLQGGKSNNYRTPALKRAQMRSKLRLIQN